jgi:hypothetical protein
LEAYIPGVYVSPLKIGSARSAGLRSKLAHGPYPNWQTGRAIQTQTHLDMPTAPSAMALRSSST